MTETDGLNENRNRKRVGKLNKFSKITPGKKSERKGKRTIKSEGRKKKTYEVQMDLTEDKGAAERRERGGKRKKEGKRGGKRR